MLTWTITGGGVCASAAGTTTKAANAAKAPSSHRVLVDTIRCSFRALQLRGAGGIPSSRRGCVTCCALPGPLEGSDERRPVRSRRPELHPPSTGECKDEPARERCHGVAGARSGSVDAADRAGQKEIQLAVAF